MGFSTQPQTVFVSIQVTMVGIKSVLRRIVIDRCREYFQFICKIKGFSPTPTFIHFHPLYLAPLWNWTHLSSIFFTQWQFNVCRTSFINYDIRRLAQLNFLPQPHNRPFTFASSVCIFGVGPPGGRNCFFFYFLFFPVQYKPWKCAGLGIDTGFGGGASRVKNRRRRTLPV